MMKHATIVLLSIAVVTASWAQATQTTSSEKHLNYTMKKLDGKAISLADYNGQVLLIVNVASRCGLTPQYQQLQSLHQKYAEQGLKVLGFPCNQFGGQEPGTAEEIQQFCSSKYDVSFDMFDKIDVNGDGACDLYKHLTALDVKPAGKGDISWNFEKFLVSREGEVIARFSPRTQPDAAEVTSAIEKELAAK